MNIQESINRGFNLLATSFTALAGFAFAPEIFIEEGIPAKMDDILIFLLSLVAIAWYNKSHNKFSRSMAPVVMMIIGVVIKTIGMFIESAGPEGYEDIGGVILFAIATGVVIYQYKKNKELVTA